MPNGDEIPFGEEQQKATWGTEHALRHHAPYAIVTPSGWKPTEATVKPSWASTGAGTTSAGCIDDTYTVQPLKNRWGKARERSENEVLVLPHKQATDLLAVAKGGTLPQAPETIADMASIRPPYSKTIPLFHPLDPQRVECGFVRSPNIIPGAGPPPQSPLNGLGSIPTVPADHKLRKLQYDQSQVSGACPVSRIVHATLPAPPTSVPQFVSKAAGLPGGLSIIKD